MTETPPPPEPPTRTLQTRELARSAKAGAVRSFAELYRRIAPALFAWASLRIHASARGRIDPGDVMQETWVRALEILHRFDPAQPFRPWIFRVAKNVLHEQIRSLGPAAAAGGHEGSSRRDPVNDIEDEATAISHRLARDERIQAFLGRIAELEADDKVLLMHLGLEGRTAAEVAAALNLSADAVFKRWQRLRHRLESEGLPEMLLDTEAAA